ncbi:hypothetical protein AC626_24305 [Pseudoalteromonas rubra]|uniref:Uncharacterized protein n=1 Tax=Pseudoalteromonas rubra TaxID=43658 RepID=A0A0L0ELP7_9GAMM|nr:hypothetical protein AC626_24305 [Pseudoalteromonas rubra]
MDNTYAYVLDAQLNALPQGARGELFVGGPCLATGYVNNPTLSAERFIENRFMTPVMRPARHVCIAPAIRCAIKTVAS